MTLFNIPLFAILSMVLGGSLIPRAIPLVLGVVWLSLQLHGDLMLLAAYLWLFWCIRLFPTQVLFTAMHGVMPEREGWITKLTPKTLTGYDFGIVAGAIRTLPALPAMLYIGNAYMAVFFAIGILYYAMGWCNRKINAQGDNVRYVEGFIGALFGMFI